jgi:zinc D-Ala-D-Ala carboxypeptidase
MAARGMVAGAAVAAARPATGGCATWKRTLRQGARGGDVANLQVRVAGWMTSHGVLEIDGDYGPATAAAVARFQAGYGLRASGVADAATLAKLDALEGPDCSPAHFSLAELDNSAACGGGFAGGRVGSQEVRTNLRRLMWKLEALRRKLHDRPLTVASGFRSVACNRRVGGASNSQHLYGTAADLVAPGLSLCTVARAAAAPASAASSAPAPRATATTSTSTAASRTATTTWPTASSGRRRAAASAPRGRARGWPRATCSRPAG